MRVLPRSHRLIMDHWEAVLHPSRHEYLPRVHGIRPRPDESAQHYPEGLPDILGDLNLLSTEPTPAVAKRGQVMVHCGAILHSAWHNPWHEARKGLLLQWVPKDVAGGLAASRIECATLPPFVRALLQPG